ncbi:GCN5 family acetyltransferase [Pseudomonas alcaligenes]|uniref:GCN5 family acetyltransferase n=1 Tax=Aquipseudomonas alcaligenes TaxID=43263 RepID=A0ABR7S412_AQUAC|nr:GNAT family N-acetyltransferase [Pseudomonas alcaligenes]MBC9252312.1 GCN5 family acetyltransferase [Pseudomonas alcaligenes]
MQAIELHSARLRLRAWRDADLAGFAALNADAEVMRHFPGVMSTAESLVLAQRIREHFAAHGFGSWVLERHDEPGLIGVLGLQRVSFEAAFTPAVEIAWRLHPAFWRQGYAREAAQAALQCAFTQLGLDEVLAFTVPANLPSQGLMQRLGMQRDAAGDFEHPRLPAGHPLRPHVLYRLSRQAWLEAVDGH